MAMFVPQSPTIRQKRLSQTWFGRPQGVCNGSTDRTFPSARSKQQVRQPPYGGRLYADARSLPRCIADFATLGEALDYAARGSRG